MENKIAVNQIYNYLDNLHNDKERQQGNQDQEDIENYKLGKEDANNS